MPEKGHQYVYFDGSDPARPVMRVAQRDEEAVIESYPWDRGDSLHMNTPAIREG